MGEMTSFQDAFYIIAKELGFDYAQPLSPRQVFEQQILPRIRELITTHAAASKPAAYGDVAPGTVRVTVEWLKKVHRDLDACQKVIWLAGCRPQVPGGFDPAYCEDAQARLKEIDEQIALAQGDGKGQR